MSTSVPPPDGGPDSGAELLEQGSGEPIAGSGSRRGRRTALLAGAGVGAAAIIAGSVWAGMAFFANGTQPSEALPASTIGYLSMDLDPSGEQQLEAFQTLRKFPAFNEEVDLEEGEDPLQRLFELVQEEGTCEDLDYADDVAPWLGTSAAVAAVDLGGDTPTPALVLGLEDADAADAGLEQLMTCAGAETETAGWAITGDWAVLAEDDATADDVVAAAEEGSLADDESHQQWMDEIGDLGMMTMYVAGGEAYVDLLDQLEADAELGAEGMDALRQQMEDFSGAAGTVRFADEGLELAMAGDASFVAEDGVTNEAGDAVTSLPQDTALAYALSVDLEQLVTSYAEYFDAALEEQGMTLDQLWEEAGAQTGLALPEDLGTLFGESIVFAVGGGIDLETAANSADGSDIPVGAKVKGDPGAVEDVLDKIRTQMGAAGADVLGSDSEGDLIAVGPNPDYRQALLGDGGLGESETFESVMGDVGDASGLLYVDFDAGDGWLVTLAEDADPKVAENLEPLSAVGFSGTKDGDVMRATFRVTTD